MNDHFAQLAFSSAGWSEDQDTRVEPRIEPRVTRVQTWNKDVHRIRQTGCVGNQSRATSIGVERKDQSNWLCEEPKSFYFKKSTIGLSIPGEFLPRLYNKGKDSGQIQWRSALKEEAFSWFKSQKEPSFFMPHLTPHQDRLENNLKRRRKEEGERKRGVTVRPTARSDLDF